MKNEDFNSTMVSFNLGRFALLSFCHHLKPNFSPVLSHENRRRASILLTSTILLNRKQNHSTLAMSPTSSSTGYLNATAAYNLDQDLFKSFSLEQLMELAGLSVAQAVHEVLAPKGSGNPERKKVLILCGPGNNGGDGLVAARHLQLFGYEVQILYPKQSKKEPHYSRLVDQCQDVGVEFINEMPNVEEVGDGLGIVDALFGFSFRGEIREPFGEILHRVMDIQEYKKEKVKVISVDVPSGWNVDDGDVSGLGFTPDVLISLTAPKLSSKTFMGRHFVGGRFLPSKLAEKYDIQVCALSSFFQVCNNQTWIRESYNLLQVTRLGTLLFVVSKYVLKRLIYDGKWIQNVLNDRKLAH